MCVFLVFPKLKGHIKIGMWSVTMTWYLDISTFYFYQFVICFNYLHRSHSIDTNCVDPRYHSTKSVIHDLLIVQISLLLISITNIRLTTQDPKWVDHSLNDDYGTFNTKPKRVDNSSPEIVLGKTFSPIRNILMQYHWRYSYWRSNMRLYVGIQIYFKTFHTGRKNMECVSMKQPAWV